MPQPLTQRRLLLTRYKDRDEIANEILELQDGKAPRSKSHDENPWKELLASEHHPKTMHDLKVKLRQHDVAHDKQVEFYEDKLFTLYVISRDLTVKGLMLAEENRKLNDERNSFRKLIRRMFALFGERTKNRLQKMNPLRLFKKKKA